MNKTVLYGICGIGNGHLYRQLPIIKELINKDYTILFFRYGSRYDYLKKNNYNVIQVEIPYFKGDFDGLNFIESSKINYDLNKNLKALSEAQKIIGKPDFVISDFEPNSAQYSYAYNVPLYTIDQQSKFIGNDFNTINNLNFIDESMRLNMFFPKAKRYVLSFFNFENKNKDIIVFPPIIRKELIYKDEKEHYLFYLSSQEGFNQNINKIIKILNKSKEIFHLYINQSNKEKINIKYNDNIKIYLHGNENFDKSLMESKGVISNAGHSLISECMYLNKPFYAIPFKTYEQHLNAKIIEDNDFGISYEKLTNKKLTKFINNINIYKNNIISDEKILKRKMKVKSFVKNFIIKEDI